MITIGKEPEMTTVTAPAVESITIDELDRSSRNDAFDTLRYAIPVIEKAREEEPIEDPREYHDSSYISSYVSVGLNKKELYTLINLFEDRKVRVKLEIMEVAGG